MAGSDSGSTRDTACRIRALTHPEPGPPGSIQTIDLGKSRGAYRSSVLALRIFRDYLLDNINVLGPQMGCGCENLCLEAARVISEKVKIVGCFLLMRHCVRFFVYRRDQFLVWQGRPYYQRGDH
jgi:hypothetical protein